MHVVSTISLIIFIAMFIAWIFAAIQSLKFSKNASVFFVSIILISILAFAYFYETDSGDLSRHYELLIQMQKGGLKFAQNESQYASLFIYNQFAFWVSQNGNFALLQTIPLIIDFLIFIYIYIDVIKYKYEANKGFISAAESFFVFFLWLTTFGLKLAITGIRCVLAVALCTLAIYMEYIRGKNRILSVLLYFFAIYIHNFTIWIIIIRLFVYFRRKFLVALAFFLVLVSGEVVFQFLYDNTTSEYLRFVCTRMLETFGEFQLEGGMIEQTGSAFLALWGGLIIIILSLLYMSSYTRKHYFFTVFVEEKNKKYLSRLFNLCYTVGIMGLPMSFNYLYTERYMYLVSWALLLITFFYLQTVKNKKQKTAHFCFMTIMALVCIYVWFFNDIYIFMANYIGYYFLAL